MHISKITRKGIAPISEAGPRDGHAPGSSRHDRIAGRPMLRGRPRRRGSAVLLRPARGLAARGIAAALLAGALLMPAGARVAGSPASSASAAPPSPADASGVAVRYLPLVTEDWRAPRTLVILLTRTPREHGLSLDYGGDVDTEVVQVGSPALEARRTGNGRALTSSDGNRVEDWYMQLRADNGAIFAGSPTRRVLVEVEYFDQGTDGFGLEYDAVDGGPFGNGIFKHGGRVVKTNSGKFRVATFRLCDAYFADRDNGADFRISDDGDGAETIRSVRVTLLPAGRQVIGVENCGASPWDLQPDSDAIQACIDQACNGDTVVFTSDSGQAGYQGYLVDKTLFLVATTAKHNLTFTSTDPAHHARLKATGGLKGFVVRLYARSRVPNGGDVDDITISHLTIEGNRAGRICMGADRVDDGVGDNWGSWLPECTEGGDPWCSPGGLAFDGVMDWYDEAQEYKTHRADWSTGLTVDDLRIMNTECATALSMGGAASTIRNTVIQTAGDHVHATGCALTDPDEPEGGWSDGITFTGPDHVITGNSVSDASDIGIVFFGGKGTKITSNVVRASPGNYGMFAGIAVHPWIFGDVSGVQVVGNEVVNEASTTCGGIHAGINIGTHMWEAGCVGYANPSTVGIAGACQAEPLQPKGTLCTEGQPCQAWAYVAKGKTLTLRDNRVTGAQVNYLVEGVDLLGSLDKSGNLSVTPRMTDWEGDAGCWMWGQFDTWATIDKAAHHPSIPGWTDQRIHCAG
jgi:hypothetical protein